MCSVSYWSWRTRVFEVAPGRWWFTRRAGVRVVFQPGPDGGDHVAEHLGITRLVVGAGLGDDLVDGVEHAARSAASNSSSLPEKW